MPLRSLDKGTLADMNRFSLKVLGAHVGVKGFDVTHRGEGWNTVTWHRQRGMRPDEYAEIDWSDPTIPQELVLRFAPHR